MNRYYKIYHYSPVANLTNIEPHHYGKGVTRGAECKRGKVGLDKSYYYTKDDPESVVGSLSTRYEIHLPYVWKQKIYDIGTEGDLWQEALQQLKQEQAQRPDKPFVFDYEIVQRQEELIKLKGYVGWTNSLHPQLPHVIVLFHPLSTQKPTGSHIVYDWSDAVIIQEPEVTTVIGNFSFSGWIHEPAANDPSLNSATTQFTTLNVATVDI